MGEGLPVRRMAAGDVGAVLALTSCSPEAAQWSWKDYLRAAAGDLDGWVAERESRVVGFLVARRVADELEILNLAVDAAVRREGVASRLLETALVSGRAAGANRAFLEVRESNAGAVAFYARQGFHLAGRRLQYYPNPMEDALVMSRKLGISSV